MADELSIHIYPSDCDTAGHVNHAYMLMLLERARWAALERHMKFDEYLQRALTAVVRHIDASYSRSARSGDDFNIRTGLAFYRQHELQREANRAQSTRRSRLRGDDRVRDDQP